MSVEGDQVMLQPEYRTGDPELWLLRTCSSLIQIVSGRVNGEDKRLVQFVHFSAQEYIFIAPVLGHREAYNVLSKFASAHITLARLCLSVLVSPAPLSTHPFPSYAIDNWDHHLNIMAEVEPAVRGLLIELLHPHRSLFSRLLEELLARADCPYPFNEHSTPLYVSASLGLRNLIQVLVDDFGVEVNVPHAPVIWAAAAANRHVEVTRLLLERGADVNVCYDDTIAPLSMAAMYGHVNLVHLLLEHGANVDALDESQSTSLHRAAQGGHVEVIRLLLESGAAVDARSRVQLTSLHVAAQNGHVDVVRLLLERGADVNACQIYTETPLHIAASHGKLDVLCLLLEHGPDIEVHNRDHYTPLYLAALRGHSDVVQHLLCCGAKLEYRTDSGWTVLHGAASEGHVEALKLILGRGADIGWRNHAGQTALLCAAAKGHDAAVRVLLDYGASVAVCDQLGFSALDHAAVGGHTAVARLLLERGADIRAENVPHGSSGDMAERASRVGPIQPRTNMWKPLSRGDAGDVARLLREARSAVARGDRVLHRLRRYRSVGSWGDIWTGVENGEDTRDAGNGRA